MSLGLRRLGTRLAALLGVVLLLGGCAAQIRDYEGREPVLDLREYFDGPLVAWGIVQDRSGEQTRSFIHVDKIAHIVIGAVDSRFAPGLYNAVEYNLSVNQVAETIKSMYPDLDIVHTNYNQMLRSIEVEVPVKLTEQFRFSGKSFEDELRDFRQRFSF